MRFRVALQHTVDVIVLGKVVWAPRQQVQVDVLCVCGGIGCEAPGEVAESSRNEGTSMPLASVLCLSCVLCASFYETRVGGTGVCVCVRARVRVSQRAARRRLVSVPALGAATSTHGHSLPGILSVLDGQGHAGGSILLFQGPCNLVRGAEEVGRLFRRHVAQPLGRGKCVRAGCV